MEQGQVRTRHHSLGKGNFPAHLPIRGLLGCTADISFPIAAVKGREGGIDREVEEKKCKNALPKEEHLLVTGSDSVTLIGVMC